MSTRLNYILGPVEARQFPSCQVNASGPETRLRYRDTDMEAVFGWVATYGYGALFLLLMLGIVGLPIPDETLLVFCGYLISKGKLNATATYAAALAGSCCGITVSYFIGRTAGLGMVHRFGKYLHVNEGQLDRVHK